MRSPQKGRVLEETEYKRFLYSESSEPDTVRRVKGNRAMEYLSWRRS